LAWGSILVPTRPLAGLKGSYSKGMEGKDRGRGGGRGKWGMKKAGREGKERRERRGNLPHGRLKTLAALRTFYLPTQYVC